MNSSATPLPAADAALPDEALARRVAAGETALFELLMRRNNPRVYRAIRSILRDEAEVEDAMQDAYISAFRNLGTFEYGARFSTWLVRIALNEALGRLRRRRRLVPLDAATAEDPPMPPPPSPSPEEDVARRELAILLEREIDALPELYRTVVVLRDVQGMSTVEAAEALGANEDAVKTRLHRGRLMLQERLASRTVEGLASAFPFHAPRCDRVVAGVMARIDGLRAS
jgi:RNA polymerase sigma-70 factor (ECF subfamily)